MSEKTLPSPNSPFAPSDSCMEAFQLFGDMPTLAIVYFLSESPKRFKELERLTQMNPSTLTARLKRLHEQGVVKRTEQEQDHQSVSYSLDNLGENMLPILHQIESFLKSLKTH